MFEESTLGALDLIFLVASLAVTVSIGLYFANKNKTFADFARGGGNQNLWAVSASMAAGYCSALTLIGNPSELYMHGTSFTLKMATTILAWPISSLVFLPVFKRLDGISIFQYIENRFSPWLRRFVSLLFVFQMTFYSAVSLYLPSLPLFTTLRIPQLLSVGFIGSVCIVYSSFGGLKAVTWTNLYHTILLLITMLAIIIVGTIQSGGLQHVLAVSYEAGRFSLGQDYFQLDLTTRHTIFNTIAGYTLIRLFLHGTSQMQVQSALSLSTMRKSQASQLISAVFYFVIQIVASSIGLLLLVNYRHCDPFLNGEIGRQDELLMHYLHKSMNFIPMLQGMFIAAIFGSTLTTMSSYLSSTSTMLVEDFVAPIYSTLRRFKSAHERHLAEINSDERQKSDKQNDSSPPQPNGLSEAQSAQIGKFASILLGLVCVLLTLQMAKISGLQQATTTIYGVIGIPILSAFVLGTSTKFVTTRGMFAGMLAAIAFGVYVFIGHLLHQPPLEPSLPISTAGCRDMHSPHQPTTRPSLLTGEFHAVLDETIDFNATQTVDSIKAADLNSNPLGAFQLARMSYLWLPFFTMTISLVVASLVSLLAGGISQTVEERFLAPKPTGARLAGKTKETLRRVKEMLASSNCSSNCQHTIEAKLESRERRLLASGWTFANLVECFSRDQVKSVASASQSDEHVEGGPKPQLA